MEARTLEECREQLLAKERIANMGDGQLRQNELEEIRERMRETLDEIQKLKEYITIKTGKSINVIILHNHNPIFSLFL